MTREKSKRAEKPTGGDPSPALVAGQSVASFHGVSVTLGGVSVSPDILACLEYIDRESHHFPPERRSTLRGHVSRALAAARIQNTITAEDVAKMVFWICALEEPRGLPFYSEDLRQEYTERAAMWRRMLGMPPKS